MNVTIRPIKVNDYPSILDIICRSITAAWSATRHPELIKRACEKYSLEKFTKKVETIEYYIAKDEDSGELLGIIGLKENELRTFFVDPNQQGKGIGRKLYYYLEDLVIKRGFKKIHLEGSVAGEPIYVKFGYKKLHTIHKEFQGHKYADAYMEKVL